MASVSERVWTDKRGRKRRAYRVGFTDRNGKRKFRQFRTRNAARMFAENVGEYVKRTDVGKDVLFGDLCRSWIAESTRGRNGHYPLDAQTISYYQTHLDLHILPRMGSLKCRELTKDAFKDFRDWLLIHASSRTNAQKILTTAKTAIGYALEHDALTVDPRPGVSIHQRARDSRAKVDEMAIHTVAEMSEIMRTVDLLRQSPDARVARQWARGSLIIKLCVYCGLRSSEVRALTTKAIDLGARRIRVFQRADRDGAIGAPKSAAGTRSIILPDDLVEELEAWIKTCRHDLVFATRNGEPDRHSNIRKRIWIKAQRAAGVRELNFHSTRHFYASRLIAAGCNAKLVSQRIGHADEAFTLSTYGHLFTDSESVSRERELVNGLTLT